MSTTTETFDTSASDIMGFQCSSCLTSYANEVEYKLHYKSEFHKYNILRKMVNLPIVSKHQFEKHQGTIKQQLARPAPVEDQTFYCALCKKKFTNDATLKNHLRTKKHILAESNKALDSEVSDLMISEGDFRKPIPVPEPERASPLEDNTACLFCSIKAASFEENLLHMERKHGFFVIDKPSCKSQKKLFRYLADKVFNKKLCLFYDYEKCGKFKTGHSVQLHMIDREHCSMNQELAEEYDRFYDFSAENEAVYARLEKKYKDLKGGVEVDFVVNTGGEDTEIKEEKDEDDDWEDVGSDAGEGSATEADPVSGENVIKEGKATQKRVFKLRRAKMLDTGELLLPSGKIAGHKDFLRYYKQRPHVNPQAELRRLSNGRGVYTGRHTYEQSLMLKNAGGAGKLMISDYNRHLNKIQRNIDKRLKNVYRKKDLLWMKLGLTGNLTYQKYFRDSTMVFG
jgi:hypothetical protein